MSGAPKKSLAQVAYESVLRAEGAEDPAGGWQRLTADARRWFEKFGDAALVAFRVQSEMAPPARWEHTVTGEVVSAPPADEGYGVWRRLYDAPQPDLDPRVLIRQIAALMSMAQAGLTRDQQVALYVALESIFDRDCPDEEPENAPAGAPSAG